MPDQATTPKRRPTSEIRRTEEQVLCVKHYEGGVEFKEITERDDPTMESCVRLYGSHASVTLQLRALSSLTGRRGGKKRRLIATAGLNKKDVRALIDRLTEIEPTMYDSGKDTEES